MAINLKNENTILMPHNFPTQIKIEVSILFSKIFEET